MVAYPTVDRGALAELVASPSAAAAITLMVDDVAHLDVVDSVRSSPAVPVRVAIDVDAGLRMGGQHVGPKRSPLHDAAGGASPSRATIAERARLPPGRRDDLRGPGRRLADDVPTAARPLGRRAPAQGALADPARGTPPRDRRRRCAELADLEFWNAGGSGSVEATGADPVVTEVAAGSGLLVPTLFDHYRSFEPRPASYFGLPVDPPSLARDRHRPRRRPGRVRSGRRRPAADPVGPGRAST